MPNPEAGEQAEPRADIDGNSEGWHGPTRDAPADQLDPEENSPGEGSIGEAQDQKEARSAETHSKPPQEHDESDPTRLTKEPNDQEHETGNDRVAPHAYEQHATGHTRGPQENQQPHVYDRLDGDPTLGIHRRQQATREHETRHQEASHDKSSYKPPSLVLLGHLGLPRKACS